MTTTEARTLAQADPVANLTKTLGDDVFVAKCMTADLCRVLARLDDLRAKLEHEHGITVSIDLGAVGNQAAAARRDLERQRDEPSFELPR